MNDLEIDLATQLAEALAEVERLKQRVQLGADIIEAKDKHRAELEAEVERLRGTPQGDMQGGVWGTYVERLDRAEAEVERLQTLNEKVENLWEGEKAEVERLRAGIGHCAGCDGHDIDLTKEKA